MDSGRRRHGTMNGSGMGSGAEQADAVRDAEATDHSFKRPFRTLADNPTSKRWPTAARTSTSKPL